MSFTHTHEGVPCQMDGCALPYDKPAMVRDELLDDVLSMPERNPRRYRQEYEREWRPTKLPLLSQNVTIIGTRDPGDRVLPLRLVHAVTGQVMIRCVGMKPDAYGCSEEWDMTKMSPADLSEAIIHAFGHLA